MHLSFCIKSRTLGTQVWVSLGGYFGVEQQINLQLTGKTSLKLDSNSRLLLEYGRNSPIKTKLLTLLVLLPYR